MDLMELRKGARVATPDGRDLGKIERYVIDPSSRDVTHIVIEKGVMFPQERVVPTDALRPGPSEGQLTLSPDLEADMLPEFEERHYVELGDETRAALDAPSVPTSVWAYPIAPAGQFPIYPALAPSSIAVESTRNVPEGSIVVTEGAHVLASDGDDVGKVKEVGTDESGHLAYLIVNPGLFQSERLIPAHWISAIHEDQVRLAVGTETLRRYDRDR